jgi:hypothetical protein
VNTTERFGEPRRHELRSGRRAFVAKKGRQWKTVLDDASGHRRRFDNCHPQRRRQPSPDTDKSCRRKHDEGDEQQSEE